LSDESPGSAEPAQPPSADGAARADGAREGDSREGEWQAEEARARDVALLDACFRFPCDFSLSVIANNEESVTAAIIAAATVGGRAPVDHQRQPSKAGKYVSHRLEVRCSSAAEAHALRVKLRAIPGVINVL
jgi:putative lipoic acid-binding regulatory protein